MAQDTLTQDITAEVESLYRFFAGWYTGGMPRDQAVLRRQVYERLAPDFLFIGSTGTLMDGDRLVTEVDATHGSAPGLAIEIHELRVRHVLSTGVVITYQEWQTEGDVRTGVTATAVLDHTGPWRWLHIHETALPGPVPRGT